jgi:DNA (cytosine-5)-methyltransferase 1
MRPSLDQLVSVPPTHPDSMFTSITAVDLFCGAGGLTFGLENSGIEVKAGYDIDPSCEYPYSSNTSARYFGRSVEDIGGSELQQIWGDRGFRLLAGCAPCQPFSTYSQGKVLEKDDRWHLLKHFQRLVEDSLPDLVTMENVPGLRNKPVFREFVSALISLSFEVDYRVVNCAEYGVPQQRQRLVLLASRLGPIRLAPGEHRDNPPTVEDVLRELPAIDAGQSCKADAFHRSAGLQPINMRRIRSSKPGGTWRDWEPDLLCSCHQKATGDSYAAVYGRMRWDEPAPTLTTQFFNYGSGRFGHPEQDRALSLREGALLQSFPPDYAFCPREVEPTLTTMGRLIGNAVPVKLGVAIGLAFMRHVEERGSRLR